MIGYGPSAPEGVLLHENTLEDRALQQDYPMNANNAAFSLTS